MSICDAHPGLCDEVKELGAKVDKNSDQISEWRGMIKMWGGLLFVLNLIILGVTAYAAVVK